MTKSSMSLTEPANKSYNDYTGEKHGFPEMQQVREPESSLYYEDYGFPYDHGKDAPCLPQMSLAHTNVIANGCNDTSIALPSPLERNKDILGHDHSHNVSRPGCENRGNVELGRDVSLADSGKVCREAKKRLLEKLGVQGASSHGASKKGKSPFDAWRFNGNRE